MPDPLLALIVVSLACALLVVLFWPVRGLYWRGRRLLGAGERVWIEDALKHLYDCEYRHRPATLQSLSGALQRSGNRTAELLERLGQLKLVVASGTGYELTVEGRRYALRVLRIHRLWERYLAEETGLEAPEWHREAEYREHRTSIEEAEALASRMGQPRYDPHGDPIPTAAGDIEPPRGTPLTALTAGQMAEIVHLEDEPAAVFSQLVAEGLHPGMIVQVLEVSAKRIRLASDTDEHVLAPVLAGNVTVVPVAAAPAEEPFEHLSALGVGEAARVVGIARACRSIERRRLLDLGVVPGTPVEAALRSPGGDPTAYRIRGTLIALRREQADLIHIERAAEGGRG